MDDLKLFAKKGFENLVNTVKIFSDDIKMNFGLSKRACTILKRGKNLTMEYACDLMKDLGKQAYKYLGLLEGEELKLTETKNIVKAEFLKSKKTFERKIK